MIYYVKYSKTLKYLMPIVHDLMGSVNLWDPCLMLNTFQVYKTGKRWKLIMTVATREQQFIAGAVKFPVRERRDWSILGSYFTKEQQDANSQGSDSPRLRSLHKQQNNPN